VISMRFNCVLLAVFLAFIVKFRHVKNSLSTFVLCCFYTLNLGKLKIDPEIINKII